MQVSVNAAGRHVMIPVEVANELGFTAGQQLTQEQIDKMVKATGRLAVAKRQPELTGSPH